MIKLSEHNISATPSTANTLEEDEQKSLLKEIPQWEINRYGDQNQLERNFTLNACNRVGKSQSSMVEP
jgi:hypothetical protein